MAKKPKPTTPKNAETVKKPIMIDSDEDVVEPTPEKNRKIISKKRKIIQILSSDSEEEFTNKPKQPKEKERNGFSNLKPIDSLKNVFGDAPVKQAKVVPIAKPDKIETPTTTAKKAKNKKQKKVETEIGVHNDKAFEKTLLELDEDILIDNLDLLDQTVEEALAKANTNSPTKDSHTQSSLMSPKGSFIIVLVILHFQIEFICIFAGQTPNRKRKISENESGMDPDEERYEKRRQSAALYQRYLNRGGPRHRGSKEMPEVI